MKKILKKRNANGDIENLLVSVETIKKDLVLTFVQEVFSDNNKWGEKKVLTDVRLTRFKLFEAYSALDPTGEKTIEYLTKQATGENDIVQEMKKLSKETEEIIISLPTSRHSHSRGIPTNDRMFKNTFLPLIVNINGKDVSRDFWNFDIFESNAVNVAYQALIKGEIPTSNNDLVDFYGVQKLHQQFIQDEVVPTSAEENILSK
ncbi:MAG: hypothetical protein E7379_03650 [Clostridiales bacterium]|nr:hypothetical protein [Clostridiales bacterium]